MQSLLYCGSIPIPRKGTPSVLPKRGSCKFTNLETLFDFLVIVTVKDRSKPKNTLLSLSCLPLSVFSLVKNHWFVFGIPLKRHQILNVRNGFLLRSQCRQTLWELWLPSSQNKVISTGKKLVSYGRNLEANYEKTLIRV